MSTYLGLFNNLDLINTSNLGLIFKKMKIEEIKIKKFDILLIEIDETIL